MPRSVIGIPYGFAFGRGLEPADACDIRVANDQAVFGMAPEGPGVVYRRAGGIPQVTHEMARKIAANAPLSIRGTKRILDMCMEFRFKGR